MGTIRDYKYKLIKNLIDSNLADFCYNYILTKRKVVKHLIDTKKDNQDLLELHMILEAMLDRSQNELMNKRLNLLTIWSTIFLPLSFYTGMWGMNFDDVPLLTGDHGFWIFIGLTVVTIVGMWIYFKKNRWI